MGAVETLRDALFGNPPSSTTEPSREGTLAAFTEMQQSVEAAVNDAIAYATVADLPVVTVSNNGARARVYDDPTAANNTYWIVKDGAWAIDTDYIASVATIVQPLVDEAEDAAVASAASAVEFGNFRDNVLSIPREQDLGVADPQAGDSDFATGSWVFMEAIPVGKVLTEFEIMVTNTLADSITIVRLSESGGVFTEEDTTGPIDLVGQPTTNLLTAADFGEFTFPNEGEYLGFWFHASQVGRRLSTNPGLTPIGFGGAGHLTSYTPTQNAAFAQMQVRAKLDGPEDTVTAVRLNAVEAAVGISTDRTLLVFGDSLATDGQGFVDELSALLLGRPVVGQAVGGQQSGSIAARAGGIEGQLTVTGASIPVNGGSVGVSAFTPNPFAASIGTDATFLASVNDVPGILTKDDTVYTFTRSDVGGPIAVSNPVKFRLMSLFVNNTTGSGATLLSDLTGGVGVVRVGHNDVFNDIIRDIGSYSRQGVKDYLAEIVDALGGDRRCILCSITRGYSWLTQARVDGLLGPGSGITGEAGSDAETIEAVIEANALNQWMADYYPGYVDLMAAYADAEPSPGDYLEQINLGSGHVYYFGNDTLLPDGTHGTDGGLEQTISAQAVADKIEAMGL